MATASLATFPAQVGPMCGIIGLLASDPSRSEMRELSALLSHRGPDDAGVYVDRGVALATRRLSIIDVRGGHQPLSNEDGTIWITYNGEVMNAPALRAELKKSGHTFETDSDTEVVVHAYEEWGMGAIQRFRGMFAFGLWDARHRRLLLARDRFGIKPLYYARDGADFAFASEIRPLLSALPRLGRRADPRALWRLFEVGFIPTPLTAFHGVLQLPPAHLLAVEGGEVHVRPYWQLRFPPREGQPHISLDAASESFAHKLRETVDAWRLSDVPLGSLLSGGVDSAALAALLTEVSGGPIHTFSIGFQADTHDEAGHARETSRHLGSIHHEVHFGEDDFDLLPQVVRHLEAPQCSATSVPLYMLYRACHQAGFKVILTGEGADELLGGYHWFDGDRRLRPLLLLPRLLRRQLARLPLPVSPGGRRVLGRGTRDPLTRYALWQEVAAPARRRALLRVDGAQPPLAHEWRRAFGHDLQGRSPLHQFLSLEAQTRMVDFINFEVDRMSMAASVEARPPFLDHRLWEFCAQLPPRLKLDRAGNKLLLRQAMASYLPGEIRRRPKRGLATPHAAWWRRRRLPSWAEESLHPAALAESGFFHAPLVGRLREEHRRGIADHSRLLMGVLTTQLWYQEMEVGADRS